MAFIAVVLGTIGGFAIGWIRSVSGSVIDQILASVFEVFRSVPLLIQLIVINSLNYLLGFHYSALTVSVIVLGLYASSFCAELVLSALSAVPPTTRKAARSLGLTYWQDMRYIVFPIAVNVGLPNWVNLALALLKDTSMILDWNRGTASRIPDRNPADPGAFARAIDRWGDLFPYELPACPAERLPRLERMNQAND